jgi:regulator of sirC expression with transglutaminase-like and TPR domain
VGIRAAAVPLPGHVLLRLYSGRRSLLVDPFQGGRITTRRDCVRYLTENGLVPRAEWFRDARPEELFLRQILNLMHSYQARGMRERARELRTLAALMQVRVPRRRTQKRRG